MPISQTWYVMCGLHLKNAIDTLCLVILIDFSDIRGINITNISSLFTNVQLFYSMLSVPLIISIMYFSPPTILAESINSDF